MASPLEAARALNAQARQVASEYETPVPTDALPSVPMNRNWPEPIAEEAYHGIIGEVVRAIEPDTEADPAAILTTALTYAGNAIGRGPHAIAEADRHGTNLFAVLVGDSAKGRKGASEGRVRGLMCRVDETWTSSHIMSGLSSGEGLLWAVRDPIEKTEAIKDKNRATGEYQTIIVDQGIEDKRLMVTEGEFASVLKVMSRDSNTLSAYIRHGWDSGTLRVMTKNSPAVATGAHISIIGHITKDELLRYLTDTEMGNGFANRFLWMCARRSKILPEGGSPNTYNLLVPQLRTALERAKDIGRLSRDDEARELWAEIYPDLSEGKPGLFGSVTARAEAQVLRISVLYAALDGDTAIRVPHLGAALAIWDYSERSTLCIFGDATGDPVADRIYEALCREGTLSRTEIHARVLYRHVKADRLSQALNLLLQAEKITFDVNRDGEGRHTEMWTPTANKAN